MTETLKELQFTDLLVGGGFFFVKGVPGRPGLVPLDGSLREEGAGIENSLTKLPTSKREFTFSTGGVFYRVSRFSTIRGQWFALRRGMEYLPELDKLGFPEQIIKKLLSPDMRSGLVLVCGPMGSGKTTSASALVAARLKQYGGHAITLEDPPELPLHGEHGEGICLQREVEDRDFSRALVETLRHAAPGIIYLGELREPAEASQALRAAINGHLIVTTVHAAGIIEGLRRISALGQVNDKGLAPSMLAEGLSCVIHQNLEETSSEEGINGRRLKVSPLFVGKDDHGIMSKIRGDQLHQLGTEIQQQRNQLFNVTYSPRLKPGDSWEHRT